MPEFLIGLKNSGAPLVHSLQSRGCTETRGERLVVRHPSEQMQTVRFPSRTALPRPFRSVLPMLQTQYACGAVIFWSTSIRYACAPAVMSRSWDVTVNTPSYSCSVLLFPHRITNPYSCSLTGLLIR